jgi:hypothetical protein
MVKRKFTPKEANRTLPLVRRIVADILAKAAQLRAASLVPQRTDDAKDLVAELEGHLHELMRELDSIGCSYKDWGFRHGLVDFPATIDGEEVLLCWRTDEPHVGWYHRAEAGFAGRKRIPAELLGENQSAT